MFKSKCVHENPCNQSSVLSSARMWVNCILLGCRWAKVLIIVFISMGLPRWICNGANQVRCSFTIRLRSVVFSCFNPLKACSARQLVTGNVPSIRSSVPIVGTEQYEPKCLPLFVGGFHCGFPICGTSGAVLNPQSKVLEGNLWTFWWMYQVTAQHQEL